MGVQIGRVVRVFCMCARVHVPSPSTLITGNVWLLGYPCDREFHWRLVYALESCVIFAVGCFRGNVSAPGARRASFWTRAPPVTF